MQPQITISLPCYQRPERTKRAILSVVNQNFKGMEVFITGDCCPFFDESFSKWVEEVTKEKTDQGNDFYLDNLNEHSGGWGYKLRNLHINMAEGKYFMFMGSDDIIKPNHIGSIVEKMDISGNDFMYFDTWVEPYNCPRNAQLKENMIGHSELIIKTEFLKKIPPHDPVYGHDWKLVQDMMLRTNNYHKMSGVQQNYIVKSVPGKVEQGID
jgi:hypothetical protein